MVVVSILLELFVDCKARTVEKDGKSVCIKNVEHQIWEKVMKYATNFKRKRTFSVLTGGSIIEITWRIVTFVFSKAKIKVFTVFS